MTDTIGLKYKIVGRYMEGTSVVAYHIVGTNGTEVKASKDLVTYYIGRGLVTNAKCQPSANGSLIIRGVGINLNDLPVKNERTGELKDSHGGQSIRNAIKTHKKNIVQTEIIARMFSGNKAIGYVLRDIYGNEKKIDRDTVMMMAEAGRISNAQLAQDGDEKFLRGVGCKIDELPRISISRGNKVEVIDERKDEVDNKALRVEKKNFSKTVDVKWEEVKEIDSILGSKGIRDINSNAQGGYKYPIMEVLESSTARMFIDIGSFRYEISEISAGTSGIDSSYGIRMVLTAITEGIEVKCNDISYLAFQLHNLGLIAFVALCKLKNKPVLKELYFSDATKKLMWREYFGSQVKKNNNNDNRDELTDTVSIEMSDIVNLDRVYNVELSPISNLGVLKKYPTTDMVVNGSARLSVRTTSGYYECEKLFVQQFNGYNYVNIIATLVNKVKKLRKNVLYERLSKEQLSTRNLLLICSAAMKGKEQLELAMVECNIESSALAYDFSVKLH